MKEDEIFIYTCLYVLHGHRSLLFNCSWMY